MSDCCNSVRAQYLNLADAVIRLGDQVEQADTDDVARAYSVKQADRAARAAINLLAFWCDQFSFEQLEVLRNGIEHTRQLKARLQKANEATGARRSH